MKGKPPADLSDSERALLKLVEIVTLRANRTSAEDIEQVRRAGWSEEQIAEAVYVTAVFAMFNRVADAFGLVDPNYRQMTAEGLPTVFPAEKGRPENTERSP